MEQLPFEVIGVILDWLIELDTSDTCLFDRTTRCLLLTSKALSKTFAPYLYRHPLYRLRLLDDDLSGPRSDELEISDLKNCCKLYRTLYLSAEGLTSLPYVKYVDVLSLDYIVDLYGDTIKNHIFAEIFINAPGFGLVKKNSPVKQLEEFAAKKQSLKHSQMTQIVKAIVREIALAAINATCVTTSFLTKDLLPLLYHTHQLTLEALEIVEKSGWPNDLRIPKLALNISEFEVANEAIPFIAALSQDTLETFLIQGGWLLSDEFFEILYRHRKSLRSFVLREIESGTLFGERTPCEFPCLEECELAVNWSLNGQNIFTAVSLILSNAPNLRDLKITEVPGNARPLIKLLPSLKLNALDIEALSAETLGAVETQADTLTHLTLSLAEEDIPSLCLLYCPFIKLSLLIDPHNYQFKDIFANPLSKLQNLTYLSLNTIAIGDDGVASTLVQLIHLKEIVLECPCLEFTSKALVTLSELPHLEMFSFFGTSQFKPNDLLTFVESVPTLFEVDIFVDLDQLPPATFQKVADILLSRGGTLQIGEDLDIEDEDEDESLTDEYDDYEDFYGEFPPEIDPLTGLQLDSDDDTEEDELYARYGISGVLESEEDDDDEDDDEWSTDEEEMM